MRMTFMRIASALLVGVLIALGTQGCGGDSTTESQPSSSTTTASSNPGRASDYINRGDAIHGFSDVLNNPGPGFVRLQSGSFIVANKGICQYHRFANEMGWSIHCKSADSGQTSRHRFTP